MQLPPRYYLQDSRGNTGDNLMFWAAGGGYTSNLAHAEVFTEEAAFSQNASRAQDLPWPADYCEARSRPVVDMQYLKPAEALAVPHAGCDQFYLQQRGTVGNDILLTAADGKAPTTNLRRARVFERDELFDAEGKQLHAGTAWPKSYLAAKSRLAVDCQTVSLKEALKDVARPLAKLPRKKVERYRCQGCGVFMSVASYYAGACRCGCDNRP